MKKQAIYDAQNLGFRSKNQMRFLLDLASKYPDRYKWVYDVLKEHGVPERDSPLLTYWEGPYNVSPDTPSYTYKSKRKTESMLIEKLIKFANELDNRGLSVQADKLDEIIPALLNTNKAMQVANAFWSLWKNEIPTTKEGLLSFFNHFESFKLLQELYSSDQEEARRYLGDKILGRG
jgi:hypothetical protein